MGMSAETLTTYILVSALIGFLIGGLLVLRGHL
jgi:hypothetical protein